MEEIDKMQKYCTRYPANVDIFPAVVSLHREKRQKTNINKMSN